MAIHLKTAEEIGQMRVAGRLAGEVLDFVAPRVKPGVTTGELDRLCHELIVHEQKAIPAPLNYAPPGYKPFPKSICTSVNHQVCHGIPGERVLKAGDILNIDVTVIKDGFHGDSSRMYYVGEPSIQAKRLCETTYECMWLGIREVRPGAFLGDVGAAIQQHAETHGYSVVREFCGHGIGRKFHEEPQVLHYGRSGTGTRLQPGMTFTIEPMINAGKPAIRELADGWTIVTKDHSLSAQWEHTVLVTGTGFEVLTLSAGTPPPPHHCLHVVPSRDACGRRRHARRPEGRRASRARRAAGKISRDGGRHYGAARASPLGRPRPEGDVAPAPIAGTPCAARGRRLRARGALPSFRRRRAGAAAGPGFRRPRDPDRKTRRTTLGHRARARPQRAHRRRVRRGGEEGRHRDDQPPRSTTTRRKPRPFRPFRSRAGGMPRRQGVFQGKALGAGTAPYQIPGQPLQPRAQSQGSTRRPSRPAGDPLDQPGLRAGKFLDGIGAARPDYAGGSAPGAEASQIAPEPAGAPALRRRAPRRPTAVRLPG